MWPRIVNTLLGVWLMAAPAVLGYTGAAAIVDRILGPVAASLAITAMGEATRSVRHANLLIGVLLVAAPWVLGYATTPTINSMVVGAVMVAMSRIRGRMKEDFAGGWTRVWRGWGGEAESSRPTG